MSELAWFIIGLSIGICGTIVTVLIGLLYESVKHQELIEEHYGNTDTRP